MADVESGLPKVQQEPSKALRIGVENKKQKSAKKLEQPRQDDVESSWAKLSIYRIPHHLKDGDEKAYVPHIVSLGPYHQGEEHLRLMEQHKLRCLHQILKRSHHEKCLYLDSVKEVEQRARACYEGTISISSDDFVQMMVLDGCFVIELFPGVDEGFEKLFYPCNDPVFSKWGLMLKTQIQRDMIMLENQIPLFILDRLLSLQLGVPYQEGRVAKLALQFFNPLVPGRFRPWDGSKLNFETLCNHGEVHCLEVFQRSLRQLGPKRSKTQQWWGSQGRQQLIFCLTKLWESGIKIRRRDEYIWWDIQFKDGILRIPWLQIHEGTRSLFLNLIAFDQSQFDCSNDVTSYVIFMHNLIDSTEDVLYLRNRGIIEHCLGSDAEVVNLFNRLCQGVAFNIEDSYLFLLSLDVREYCDEKFLPIQRARGDRGIEIAKLSDHLARKWGAWVAVLKNKYFDTPWSIISLIAAFIFACVYFLTWPLCSLWLLQAALLISHIVEII